jgi:peptidoglycan/xylan/chitin deacetylase (PgdA/CDA1 family)
MHPLGRFMIASSALPLAAPAIPPAAPALLSAWAALHAAFMWTLLRPGGTLLAPNIQRGPSEGSRVALTFDDGPRGDHTRWLLDRLGEAGIPGTFFAVGERARKDKEVIRRIVSEGHTLGNHTQTHPASWALAGRRRVFREIDQAQETLAEIAGRPPAWFRPPMGHKSVYLREALDRHGLRQVTWSVRSLDTVLREPGRVIRRVLSRADPGGIILLHEGIGGAGNSSSLAGELIGPLVRGLGALGLSPVSLEGLLLSPPRPSQDPAPAFRPVGPTDEPAR